MLVALLRTPLPPRSRFALNLLSVGAASAVVTLAAGSPPDIPRRALLHRHASARGDLRRQPSAFSIDYAVFLLVPHARELHETQDNARRIRFGLDRTPA